MSLSDRALQELNKIIEEDYGILLDASCDLNLLKGLGFSVLNLFAATIKARSRAGRLGIPILPSCMEDRSQDKTEQQNLPFE